MDPDQTVPIGAVCSGSTLFASILNWSVMLGNYLQQTTSADDIFRCIFFLGALRVKVEPDKLEVVAHFDYLSDMLSADRGCEMAVSTHDQTVCKTFRELLSVQTSRHPS